ncbi:OsmC family protein [Promicromonospora sp. NPDC023987]|uniref:OsmC family protein n=1 Tax=Promicromonospora sp. NPDC023987 TaxID=3155360 RepID=UPI0033C6846C
MTEQTTTSNSTSAEGSATPSPTDPLWVERNGTRTYTGFSARGARVEIGPVEAGAVFTPGELLKVALAACAGMSSDKAFSRRLGDDYRTTIRVEDPKNVAEDRYPVLTEKFEIDLSTLDDEDRAKLLTIAQRSIDKACTVGRTLKTGAQIPDAQFQQPTEG